MPSLFITVHCDEIPVEAHGPIVKTYTGTIETVEDGRRIQQLGSIFVEIRSDERFFTVRDMGGGVVGTIIRPTVLGNSNFWTAAMRDGEPVIHSTLGGSEFLGPRGALRHMIRKLYRDLGYAC